MTLQCYVLEFINLYIFVLYLQLCFNLSCVSNCCVFQQHKQPEACTTCNRWPSMYSHSSINAHMVSAFFRFGTSAVIRILSSMFINVCSGLLDLVVRFARLTTLEQHWTHINGRSTIVGHLGYWSRTLLLSQLLCWGHLARASGRIN